MKDINDMGFDDWLECKIDSIKNDFIYSVEKARDMLSLWHYELTTQGYEWVTPYVGQADDADIYIIFNNEILDREIKIKIYNGDVEYYMEKQ